MSDGFLLSVEYGGVFATTVDADEISGAAVARDNSVDISVDRLGDRNTAEDLGVGMLSRDVFLASWSGRGWLIALSLQ
jgi:hypothetical protein